LYGVPTRLSRSCRKRWVVGSSKNASSMRGTMNAMQCRAANFPPRRVGYHFFFSPALFCSQNTVQLVTAGMVVHVSPCNQSDTRGCQPKHGSNDNTQYGPRNHNLTPPGECQPKHAQSTGHSRKRMHTTICDTRPGVASPSPTSVSVVQLHHGVAQARDGARHVHAVLVLPARPLGGGETARSHVVTAYGMISCRAVDLPPKACAWQNGKTWERGREMAAWEACASTPAAARGELCPADVDCERRDARGGRAAGLVERRRRGPPRHRNVVSSVVLERFMIKKPKEKRAPRGCDAPRHAVAEAMERARLQQRRAVARPHGALRRRDEARHRAVRAKSATHDAPNVKLDRKCYLS
jgi:hypothetical protein